jgi:hypothetical protein
MTDSKRVVVTGATGLIGRHLCKQLAERGYQVVIFTRNPEKARSSVPEASEYVAWTPKYLDDWANALNGAYGLIHLAGAPIFGPRWDDHYKAEIRDSRIVSTRVLFGAMTEIAAPPQVFVSGSAVGYYGDADAALLDESAPPGELFLSQVTVELEREARRAEDLGVRTVLIRTGIVLDADEGALPQLVLPFRFYVGGPILPGTQYISWIHIEDEVGIILLALENEQAQGPMNATAPNPETNADFTGTLGKVMGTPAWLPVPGVGIKVILGELADNLVTGQRALPIKARDLGYKFKHPELEPALRDLLKK